MTTRRGFIQGIGAGVAALIVPKAAEAKTDMVVLPYKVNHSATEKTVGDLINTCDFMADYYDSCDRRDLQGI